MVRGSGREPLGHRPVPQLSDKVTGSVSYVHAFNNKIKSSVAPHNVIELKQNIINFQISYQY